HRRVRGAPDVTATRVIKVGGRPQLDAALPAALAAAHRTAPGSLVVVHGGGDEVSTLQKLYGVVAQFTGGRRVTSALDLEIVRMALSGSANKRLVAALNDVGVPALGLSGEDAGLLRARPTDRAQYGFVGTPSAVNVSLLRHLAQGGYLPVLSPVSRSDDPAAGATLNVNGDDAASAIAVALAADELLLVSDVEGVRVEGTAVARLDVDEALRLVEDGTAAGGMAAKLQAAVAALEGGVGRVRISDIAAIGQRDRGTVLTRVGSTCA
ncbi:MAG TPA: acetylglutamate kinase, partial [Gemmatimonadaceae bacterium]|nr:acetylglutamate kinase [Gemmatimonadaceae bacterium]